MIVACMCVTASHAPFHRTHSVAVFVVFVFFGEDGNGDRVDATAVVLIFDILACYYNYVQSFTRFRLTWSVLSLNLCGVCVC